MTTAGDNPQPLVGLFATCVVDLFRPSVGRASARLIAESGCEVVVPIAQTCCGQPSANSRDRSDLRAAAEQVIEAFERFDYVVAPSGSCAAMLRDRYPILFEGDAQWQPRAQAFAGKVHELVSFLTAVMGVTAVNAEHAGSATCHDACANDPDVRRQSRALLASVGGLELKEMEGSGGCCGIAGRAPVGRPRQRAAATDLPSHVDASGADLLLGSDLGCLLQIAGKLKRKGSAIEIRHIAEVLAGDTDTPPIAGRRRS